MRILHLAASDNAGGADKAAYRIHRALRAEGIDSRMLVEYKMTHDPTVYAACGMRGFAGRLLFAIRGEIDLLPLRRYRDRKTSGWTAGWLPRGLPARVRRLAPDIVHLHWLSSFGPVQELSRLGVPCIWTLQDTDAITGGCCYAGDCDRYTSGCGNCPQLQSHNPNDFSSWTLSRKLRYWSKWTVHVVGVSRWLTDMARSSAVFKTKQSDTVLNGVDTDVFTPIPMETARTTLNLPQHIPLLLFGALSLTDTRKGGHLLIEALKILHEQWPSGQVRPEMVFFGKDATALTTRLPWRTHDLGYLNSTTQLTRAYNAVNITVVPSMAEACPQIPIESLACGTPVVAFNTKGLGIIDDGSTGRLARPFSPPDLARAIKEMLLLDKKRLVAYGTRCRQSAVDVFSMGRVTSQYREIYGIHVPEQHKP